MPTGDRMRVMLVFLGTLLAGCAVSEAGRWSNDDSRPAWMPEPQERYQRAPVPAASYRDGLASLPVATTPRG